LSDIPSLKKGISNAAAAVLLIVGVVVGAVGYYGSTTILTHTVTVTAFESTTQVATVTDISVSTYTVTQNSTTNSQGASFPTLSASVTSCIYGPTSEICTLSLINSGSSSVYPTSCSMTYSGVTYGGDVGVVSVQAGSNTSVNCSVTGRDPGAGTTITGSMQFSDGAEVPFTGTASN
jgi:hypothetical protein